jgi:hypothetical protein
MLRHVTPMLAAALVVAAMPLAAVAQAPAAKPAAAPTAKPADAPAKPAAAAPAPTAAKPAASAPAGGGAVTSGDAAYEARLRRIEEQVIGIKERIFQTKARLQLLKEQIIEGTVQESRAVLMHKNEMGSFFKLESVLYYLDGKKIYFQDDSSGLLSKRPEIEIYNGTIVPGNHSLTVELVYRGNSSLFTYLKGYVFKLKSSYTFYAAKGRITHVSVVGYERGGFETDLEDKPYIRYEVRQERNKAKPAAKASDK